jgi:hypothetical protein
LKEDRSKWNWILVLLREGSTEEVKLVDKLLITVARGSMQDVVDGVYRATNGNSAEEDNVEEEEDTLLPGKAAAAAAAVVVEEDTNITTIM